MDTLLALIELSVLAMPFIYYKRRKKHNFKQGTFKAIAKVYSIIIILPLVLAFSITEIEYAIYLYWAILGSLTYIVFYKED